MDRFRWDDLQFVSAVSAAGSVRGAAARLDVSHQTVARRVGSLEDELGTKLFLRTPDGCLPTAAAEELANVARDVADRIGDAVRKVKAERLRPAGTVRVALLDSIVPFLAPFLGEFSIEFPEITLEFIQGPKPISFSKREADVAIRFTSQPPDDLVGRRIAEVGTAIYASNSYLERVPRRRGLQHHTWIGWDSPFARWPIAAWVQQRVADERVVARVNSGATLIELIRADMGVGILPCLIGDAEPNLTRVRKPLLGIDLSLWQLTHPDLRRSAPVRAFMDFLRDRLAAHRDLIEGRCPR